MEGLTWGGERTIQYTDDILQNRISETWIILLTNVTPINSIYLHFFAYKRNAKCPGEQDDVYPD